MAVYTFAYDLVDHPDEFDYEPLWAELKRLNGIERSTRSGWSIWTIPRRR